MRPRLTEASEPVAHAGLLSRFAKRMRDEPTHAEHMIWQELRATKLGVRFDRQKVIGPYIVDFVCGVLKLVVEVDGDVHDLPDQIAHDAARSGDLAAVGYTVLRFRNEEVYEDADAVASIIQDAVDQLLPRVQTSMDEQKQSTVRQ